MSGSGAEQPRVASARPEMTAALMAETGLDQEMLGELVDRFYAKVRADHVLGPIFDARIADWGPHLERMTAFWSSVALMTGRYHGSPVAAHGGLPVGWSHFERWLGLFRETARARGLNALCIPSRGQDRLVYDRLLVDELRRHAVDLVCLAVFMRLLSAEFVSAFPGRILNIHPSLLPAFPGMDAQRQALEYGVKITGVTVHFVTRELDAGPILMQRPVPVLETDSVETLSARILAEEHRVYPEAVKLAMQSVADQGKART